MPFRRLKCSSLPLVNFTAANLMITDIFPADTQALVGAVYQAVSQLGISIGIAVMAVISNAVTDRSSLSDKASPDALMKGFRAVFWTCFAMMVLSTIVAMWVFEDEKQSEEVMTPVKLSRCMVDRSLCFTVTPNAQ